MDIAYNQLLLLLLQCLIIGLLLASLFRLRNIFGLGLLYIALGVFQFLQVFLASSLLIEVASGIFISSGSMVLFSASLFMVLLVYIREDALETRKIIYALLAANLVTSLLLVVFGWSIDNDVITNLYNLPREFFSDNARILLVGTLIFLFDAFAIIFIYEFISKYIKPLFLRILFTMILVLSLDSLLFALGIFYGKLEFQNILISGLIAKNIAAVIYSSLFTLYLVYFDTKFIKSETEADTFKDIFHKLTFRQKYEDVFTEMKNKSIELEEAQKIAQLGTFNLDLTTMLFSSSPIFDTILGFNLGKTKKFTTYQKIVHPDDLPENKIILESCIKTGKKFDKEYRIFTRNTKELKWIHGMGEVICIEGEPAFFKGTIQDITKQKLAKKNLQLSEDRFHRFANASFEGIGIAVDGIIQDVNDYLSEMSGYSREELVGSSSKMIVHPDDLKMVADYMKKGYEKTLEFRILKKDGKVTYVEGRGADITYNGKNARISNFYDISDRMKIKERLLKSEEKFSKAYFNNPIPIFISSIPDGEFIDINPKFEEISGRSRKELIGKKVIDLEIYANEQDRLKLFKELENKGKLQGYEIEFKTKSGEIRDCKMNSEIIDIDGESCLISIVNDITEQKKAEEALRILATKFSFLSGSNFIENVCRHITESLNIEIAFVGELKPDENRVVVNYGIGSGKSLEFFEYDLAGTPCEKVIGKEACSFPKGVQELFPNDYLLTEMGVEGYIGVPLFNSLGNTLGIMVILDNKMIDNPSFATTMLQIFSERIAAEIERTRAEEALKLSLSKNEILLNATSDLVILIDIDGKIKAVNESMAKSLRSTPDKLHNKVVYDFMTPTIAKSRKEIAIEAAKTGKAVQFIDQNRDLWFANSAYPIFNENEQFKQLAIFSQDITSRKQAEQNLIGSENKYKNLFDKNPISLWEEDFSKVKQLLDKKITETSDLKKYLDENPDFIFECVSKVEILNVNNISLDLFGVRNTEELTNHLSKTFNDKSIELFKEELLAIASNKKEFSGETEFIRSDGEIITALINFLILDDSYEKAIVSIVDITELNRAKENIGESQRKFQTLFDKNSVSLWEVDFYEVKRILDEKKTQTKNLKKYLDDNIDFVMECISKIEILDVNEESLGLMGANTKIELRNTLGEKFNKKTIEVFKRQLIAIAKNEREFSEETEFVKSSGEIITTFLKYVKINEASDKALISIIDITALTSAKEEIVESEKKFRELYEKSGDAILIIENGVFVECNQATIHLLEYKSKEDFLASHPSKLSPILQPDGRKSFDKANEMMNESLTEGTHRFEWIHTKKNGTEFPVEVLLTAITNEPDNQIIHCVWRDITGRKQAEQSLVESENELRQSQEIAQLGTFNVDLTTQSLTSSLIFDSIAGFDSGKIKKFATFQATVHPDDLDEKEKMLQNCIKTGKRFDNEYRIFTKNTKELKWIHAMGEVIYIKDAPAFFKGTIQDITKRKLIDLKVKINEQKLIEVQKIANLGTYEIDLISNSISTSSIYQSILGMNKRPKNNKGWWKSITHPDDYERSERLWQQCIKDCTIYNDEYRILTDKNEIKWIHDIAEVKCDNGIAVKVVGTIQDITNRKLSEEKIKRSDSILRQVNSLVQVVDKNGNITYASPSFKTILGFEPEDMLGQGWWIKTTSNLAAATKLRDSILNVVKNDVPIPDEIKNRWIKAKNGQVKLFEWINSKGEDDSIIFIGIDVTEREIAEKNSAQYWKIVENSLNEIFIFDADTLKFIEVNRGARKNIGYSSKELSKMTPVDIKPLITKRKFNELLKPLKNNTKEKIIFTSEHQRKDGTTYKAEINIQKSELKLNPVFIASIKDVTQRQKNEQIKQVIFNITKKSSESISLGELFNFIKIELGKLINTNNFFIAIYDEKTKMISTPYMVDESDDFNDFPKGKTLTGHVIDTKKALLTKDPIYKDSSNNQEVIGLGSESKCWLGVPVLIDNQAIGAIVVQSYTDENAYNEGDVILLELIASNIGQIIRKAEDLEKIKLLNQALIHTPAIVMITNKKGELEFVNSSFTNALGYEFDEVGGKNPKFLNPKVKMKEFYFGVGKSIAKKGYWQEEIINVKKNGDLIRVSASIAPVKDKDHNVSHYIIIEEDITEKRKLERQFINAIIEAQDIEKQNFGEELHDGISQILSAESMYIDLLIEQNKDRIHDKAKFLTKIKELNSSAINETRNIAHGLMSSQLKQSGLLISVENICIDFSNKKNIEFKFVNDGVNEKELSQEIKINLFRVIQELSTNINRYSNATKAIISFSKLKKNSLKIIVKDNGIGMDYNKIKNEATGIGLQTVKRRVAYLNGNFNLETALNEGSCYTLKIPL